MSATISGVLLELLVTVLIGIALYSPDQAAERLRADTSSDPSLPRDGNAACLLRQTYFYHAPYFQKIPQDRDDRTQEDTR